MAPRNGLDAWLERHLPELVAIRRDIHAHPELAFAETRTTELVRERLTAAGLRPRLLPRGTGFVCDIGAGDPVVALRADLDALPLDDAKDVPYRSTVPGVCHACGHDVHTTVLLGTALALAELAPATGGTVRLVFQPAEETIPGGALDVIAAEGLSGVASIAALHCDPRLEAGRVGLRVGPIASATDHVEVHLAGPGGHTARPQLTADLVGVLARIAVEVPARLATRLDPRATVSLVWGAIHAGAAANVIPTAGFLRGTLRTPDQAAWEQAAHLVPRLIEAVAAESGVEVRVDYRRGVPPVVNDAAMVGIMSRAVTAAVGPEAVAPTEISLGGEDFGWYLRQVPGVLARLGVRAAGGPALDLHQASFDVDESAIGVGVRTLVSFATDGARETAVVG